MTFLRFLPAAGYVLAVLIVLATGAASAWGQPRRPPNKPTAAQRQRTLAAIGQTQSQLVEAQKALAAATAEVVAHQAAVSEAQGALEAASEASKTARSEVETMSQRVREIEQELDESQPKDSAYARAKAAFAQAKETLEQDQARVFKSPEYVALLKEATSGDAKSEKVPQLKEATLKKDLAYQRTRIDFDAARAAYDRERNLLLEKSAEWADASKSASAARLEQTKAEQKAQGSASRKAHASLKLRDAANVASGVQAKVQQLTSSLHSLQTSIGQKPTTPGETGKSKGKK